MFFVFLFRGEFNSESFGEVRGQRRFGSRCCSGRGGSKKPEAGRALDVMLDLNTPAAKSRSKVTSISLDHNFDGAIRAQSQQAPGADTHARKEPEEMCGGLRELQSQKQMRYFRGASEPAGLLKVPACSLRSVERVEYCRCAFPAKADKEK